MSATPPLTPDQIINIVNKAMERKGDLHTRITVTRKVTVPGQTEYSSEGVTFSIEVDVPHGENLIDATRRAKADLEVLVGEFKAAHLIKQSSEKGTQFPKTEQGLAEERYGVDEIEWRPNKFGEGEYAFTDHAKAKRLVGALTAEGGPLKIAGYSYDLNQAGTYIYRKPVTVK